VAGEAPASRRPRLGSRRSSATEESRRTRPRCAPHAPRPGRPWAGGAGSVRRPAAARAAPARPRAAGGAPRARAARRCATSPRSCALRPRPRPRLATRPYVRGAAPAARTARCSRARPRRCAARGGARAAARPAPARRPGTVCWCAQRAVILSVAGPHPSGCPRGKWGRGMRAGGAASGRARRPGATSRRRARWGRLQNRARGAGRRPDGRWRRWRRRRRPGDNGSKGGPSAATTAQGRGCCRRRQAAPHPARRAAETWRVAARRVSAGNGRDVST
jgi:hypothetical protein